MLLLFWCLLISARLVIGDSGRFMTNGYDVTYENNVLISVSNTSDSEDHLDLYNRNFVAIDENAFKNSRDLKKLQLQANNISNLPQNVFSPLENLQELALNDNKLTNVNFITGLSATLEILYLGFNKISQLPPGTLVKFDKLTWLSLEHNDISSVESGTFNGLASISIIDLSRNKLTNIPIETFHGLPDTFDTLILNGNKIKKVKNGTFRNSPLVSLSLSRNYITEIESGSFDGSKLESLDLDDNCFATFNPASFKGLKKLRRLDLSSRTLVISEIQLKELKKYLNEDNKVRANVKPIRDHLSEPKVCENNK